MVQVNGHSLHLEVHGPPRGPLVVLLHHGLGSVRAWKAQVPALANAGWRVAVYDRWGYGRSQARESLSTPDFSPDLDDLDAIIHELGAEQACLVGHSDGGTIALAYAAHHAGWVRGLVTVAAHIYLEPSMAPGIQAIRQTFEQDERFRQAFSYVHGAKAEGTFWNWFNAWTRLENWEWDMRPLLGKITCPALVVQGIQDEHATPQHARDIAAAIPDAELWLLPGANHMLPQESATAFNHRLLEFLTPIGLAWPDRPMEE